MLWPETTERNHSGEMEIGGVSLRDLARQYGTPLYVFDEMTIRQRCRKIKEALSNHANRGEYVFAAKACASPAILQIVASEGAGIDVVSEGELFAALQAGTSAARITVHGNNKSDAELRAALQAGVEFIVIDHFGEIAQLEELAADIGVTVNVLVRLNPGIDVHTHEKIATGVVDSKFGMPIWTSDGEDAVVAVLASNHLRLKGYHAHLGSQIFDLNVPKLAAEKLIAFAAQIRDSCGYAPEVLSPGGGLGIAYLPHEQEVDASKWIEATAGAVEKARSRYQLPAPRLIFEPGRYLIGSSAVAIYEVGAIKRIAGVRTYVSVDGGMADNIRPSLYGAEYTAALVNRDSNQNHETITIAGRYCESGDVLIKDINMPRLQSGDLIALPGAGAYTLSMASNYNLVPRPAAVTVNNGQSRQFRKRESLNSLLQHEIW